MTEQSHIPVVTGFGCITALGQNAATTWEAILAGNSARKQLTAIPVEGCKVTEGAQAELPPIPGLSQRQLARLSRASRLIHPAFKEALAHAELLDPHDRSIFTRLELSISTTACGMEKGEEFLRELWKGNFRGHTSRVAHYQAQQQIADLQQRFGFSGPSTLLSNACSGGGNAIGHAADLIRTGMADIVVAGGYDALCELVFAGFHSLQSLAPEACRPFDRGRNGLMLGEAAAFLVIENQVHARARGASVHAVVSGYGHTTDRSHLTQPDQEGAPLEKAMRMALAQSGLEPGAVGYVNAHGTGTPANDGAEAKAFHNVFGNGPTKLSSTKAALGHTLGAAGALEALLGILVLQRGQLPPQINLLNPEPLVASALVQPNQTTATNAVMSVNLGFGGSNAALLLGKP